MKKDGRLEKIKIITRVGKMTENKKGREDNDFEKIIERNQPLNIIWSPAT